MALSHESLINYYQVNYQLIQNHKYSLDELDHMMPWEREVYTEMLVDDLKQQREEQQKQQFQGR